MSILEGLLGRRYLLLTGLCRLSGDPAPLPRHRLPFSPFEIEIMIHWADDWTVNLEEDSALNKLRSAVDTPLHQWSDDWAKTMDETTALQKLHASLNPVVMEFTVPELKAILLWSSSDRHNQYGIGGSFRMPEEEILLQKLERAIERGAKKD